MKLTREDFRNYIKDYNDDEIFYRDLYFQEKNHPETFHELLSESGPAVYFQLTVFLFRSFKKKHGTPICKKKTSSVI